MDTWKIRRNFSVELGVRFSHFIPMYTQANKGWFPAAAAYTKPDDWIFWEASRINTRDDGAPAPPTHPGHGKAAAAAREPQAASAGRLRRSPLD